MRNSMIGYNRHDDETMECFLKAYNVEQRQRRKLTTKQKGKIRTPIVTKL